VMTRINSTLVNNDILGTLTNDDKKLDNMFHLIKERCYSFINQEVQSIDLLNRIVELKDLQTQGIYKAPQVKMDNKDFGIGAQIHDIDISKIRLVTNAEQTKRVGMIGYGLEITEYELLIISHFFQKIFPLKRRK
jgi:3,4-dihydroxy 2-butanone 4-phosphate synthase/GTP cyclohydrolase II